MTDLPPVPPGSLPNGSPPAEYPNRPPLAAPASPVPPGAIRAGGSWPTPPEPEPERTRRPVWVVAVAIIAVAALLGGLVAAFVGSGDGDGDGERVIDRGPVERPDESDDPVVRPPDTAPASPDELDVVVEEIKAFVAEERGLPFLRDVVVELADDEEFEARLLEDFEEDVDEIRVQGRVLEAVGLLDAGTDVVAATRELVGGAVVGFYDTETDELVVRGTSTSPYVRTVIAHELVHALDDQHFELHRPQLEDLDDEQAFAFAALYEGNASRIEDAYRDTFSAADEALAFQEELTIGMGIDIFSIPPILVELLGAPYLLGPDLVAAVLEAGGQERLDAAFVTPPTTSEHVLRPQRFLDGDAAEPVAAPAADGEVIDEGMLGALGLAQIIGESPFTGPGEGDDAVTAGWGGDRYVAWDDADGGGTCLRATVVGETPDGSVAIGAAVAEWADDPPSGVEVSVDRSGSDGVTFTSCSG